MNNVLDVFMFTLLFKKKEEKERMKLGYDGGYISVVYRSEFKRKKSLVVILSTLLVKLKAFWF